MERANVDPPTPDASEPTHTERWERAAEKMIRTPPMPKREKPKRSRGDSSGIGGGGSGN